MRRYLGYIVADVDSSEISAIVENIIAVVAHIRAIGGVKVHCG